MTEKSPVRVCAVDVGSNSIRLLVADVRPENGGVVTVARAGEPCRLGRGLERTGRVEDPLADRAAALTAEFVRRSRALGATRFIVGATAALRSAANGGEVAARIEERSGIPVRILTGDEEARLVYDSVVLGLGTRLRHSSCIVFDLGGGSTEVVSGVGPQAGRWVSLPFGAVSLTERFLHHTPPNPEEVAALEASVATDIDARCAELPAATPVLAGVGGTVTAFAILDRELPEYDAEQVEGWVIPAPRIEGLVKRITRSAGQVERGWPVLGKGRADIVVAGALVVQLLVRRFAAPGLICSTQGLRYGLARLAVRPAGAGEVPG